MSQVVSNFYIAFNIGNTKIGQDIWSTQYLIPNNGKEFGAFTQCSENFNFFLPTIIYYVQFSFYTIADTKITYIKIWKSGILYWYFFLIFIKKLSLSILFLLVNRFCVIHDVINEIYILIWVDWLSITQSRCVNRKMNSISIGISDVLGENICRFFLVMQ